MHLRTLPHLARNEKGGVELMNHETFEELMSLKLDNELDDSDERRLSEHLENCADCAQTWTFVQKADNIMRASALEPLPVPSNFYMKVVSQVAVPARQPVAVPLTPV